ncbi:MAG: GNAT family N-acetyltransferase [Actinomycetota bacterium]
MRPIRSSDAEAVAILSRAAKFEAIPNFPNLHTPVEDLEFYTREIARSSGYVVEDGSGSIVGFVIWREDFINHLYVDLAHQRDGIGSELLEKAIESMSASTVKLWTFQNNIKAVSFYKRKGFVISDATDGENDEKLPDYLLTFERWI